MSIEPITIKLKNDLKKARQKVLYFGDDKIRTEAFVVFLILEYVVFKQSKADFIKNGETKIGEYVISLLLFVTRSCKETESLKDGQIFGILAYVLDLLKEFAIASTQSESTKLLENDQNLSSDYVNGMQELLNAFAKVDGESLYLYEYTLNHDKKFTSDKQFTSEKLSEDGFDKFNPPDQEYLVVERYENFNLDLDNPFHTLTTKIDDLTNSPIAFS